MRDSAILDNSAMRLLYELGLVKNLNLLYKRVYLPRAVEVEFLSIKDQKKQAERFKFLLFFLEEQRIWFKRCNFYSSASVKLFLSEYGADERKVHIGEAESLNQALLLESDKRIMCDIILDDQEARKFARKNQFHIHGTAYLIARMDIQLQICNYHQVITCAVEQFKFRLSRKHIDNIYEQVKAELS